MSLGEAVRTTGKAKTTLQRRLKENVIPGAVRLPSGGWSIPISGLIAAGLVPEMSPADTPMKQAPIRARRGEADEVGPLFKGITEIHAYPSAEHFDELVAELAAARQREVAATQRAELLEANLRDVRQALEVLSRALPPGPPPATATVVV